MFQQITTYTPTQAQNVGQGPGAPNGPLSSLDLKNGNFNYDLYKYPISPPNPLATDKEHQIIFYINIPTQSYWNNEQVQAVDNNGTSAVVNRSADATRYGLRTNVSGETPGLGGVSVAIQNLVLSQKTVRTTAAISLYIPTTMVWTQNMKYENVSFSDSAGFVADANALINGLSNGNGVVAGAAMGNMIPDIKKLFGGGNMGNGLNKNLQAGLGVVDNPQNYLLFKEIDFRHFRFDFILTPENAQEAEIIKQIIYLFRFHSAPEVASSSIGRFFVPPSSFDIDILHNGERNPSIPRISTCVCDSVNVDYAGSGSWVTHITDGAPLQVRLGLSFTETEIVTKDRVNQGF